MTNTTLFSYTGLTLMTGAAPHMSIGVWSSFAKEEYRLWLDGASVMATPQGNVHISHSFSGPVSLRVDAEIQQRPEA